MTVKNLGDLIIWAGAVAGALGAIGTVIYWALVRPFVRWLREELGATRAAAVASSEVVDQVHAEVTPNHGSSMKDQMTRTEHKVDQLDRRFTDHLVNDHGGAA